METLAGSILGKFFEELILNPAVNDLKKGDELGKILKKVKSFLQIMRRTVNQIKDEDGPIDDREKLFIKLFEIGDNLIGKYYRSHWLLRDRKFAGEITNFYESLTDFFQIYLPVQQFNRRNEISAPQQQQQQQQSDQTEVSFSGDEIGNSGESEFTPFIVGMDRPLREVKKLLFEFKEEDDESSVIVVTAPGGCGKTTLVKQICQDPAVKGKFEDIFSFKVEHNHLPAVPDFETDGVLAIHRWLKRRRKNRPQTASLLLVFDDVWGGPDHRDEPEFPLHKFVEFKIPKCKILVTSRYQFPSIGSTYKLDLLDDEQSKKLLRHAGFLRDGNKGYDDVVDKIVKRCGGIPLAIQVVGGSLRGQPVGVWKSRALELLEGQSILDSGEGLLDCLQRSLASLKAKLKECFMDLGSFPYQAKIPITALIDMWAELYQLDINGVHAISNLCKLSLQNLLNLEITRKDADDDEAWYDDDAFVLQHDLLRDLAIRQSNQEPMAERKRLFLDLTGNKLFPEWRSREVQPCIIKARLLSISTDKVFSSSWCNMKAPEVEVLIINFQTMEKDYTLPESFIKQMHHLKVLVVTNYGSSIIELTNVSLLGSLSSSLKRIRLERVSVPTLCNTMVELKNLQKINLVMCKINQAFNSCSIQNPAENLANLQEINIDSCNDLVGLPEWICDLVNLRKLSITNCHKPSALSKRIGKLKNLEVLRLNACTKLEELPETIGSLNKLSLLDISGCFRLRKLPEQVGKLYNLTKLYMGRCSRVKELPLSVMDLKQLIIGCDQEMAQQWGVDNFVDSKNEETNSLHWLRDSASWSKFSLQKH